MKILNLYAGIGGNRKLWTDCEVTAVEYNEEIAGIYKEFFPRDTVVIGDAHPTRMFRRGLLPQPLITTGLIYLIEILNTERIRLLEIALTLN